MENNTKRAESGIIKIVSFILIAVSVFGCTLTKLSVEPARKTFDYSDEYGTEEYDHGIIFYGDTRKHHDVHTIMLENIFAFEPDAVFHLGDAVSDGANKEEWKIFEELTSILQTQVPFYPVIGNHEKGVNPEEYVSKWDMPIGQGYYSLDLDNSGNLIQLPISIQGVTDYSGLDPDEISVHIVVIHSNPGYLEEGDDQYNWLINDLTNYSGVPTILVFHIGLYMAGDHYMETGENHSAPVLYDIVSDSRFDIAACINGHDHSYQRYDVDGIKHIVTGCAGESAHPLQYPDHPNLITSAIERHMTVMVPETSEGRVISLRFTAFDRYLEIIDDFQIELEE